MSLAESEKIAQCKQIQEGLHCMICVEYFDNPHTLECGHSYCQGCLYQWLNNKKSCPECRLPISRPPCPSYVLQKIVNAFKPLVGISVTQTSSNGDASNPNSWRKLFPHYNPLGYFRDESDGVARCASCQNELEPTGECDFCNLHYDLDNEENGSIDNPIDLDMDMDMDHEPEDEYNDSDLEFLNDGEVEYDSDIGQDIDRSSYDDDSDVPGAPTRAFRRGFRGPVDSSDFDDDSMDGDLSDSAEQFDIHNVDQYEDAYEDDSESPSENIMYSDDIDEDEDDEDDDDDGGNIGVNGIWRLGAPRTTIEITDDNNDDDTSSSEDNDDDNDADYAGLADFKDEYGSANQRGILSRDLSTNMNNNSKPSSSTSTKQGNHKKKATIYLSSASENSDDDSDSNENTKHTQNDSSKKRRVILDTDDDENDDETLVPAVEQTNNINNDLGSSNGKINGNGNSKGKDKDKDQVVTANTSGKGKKNRKKRSKKNKKPFALD